MTRVDQAQLERGARWVSMVGVRYTSGCRDTAESPLVIKCHKTHSIDAHRENMNGVLNDDIVNLPFL